jgi:hypothetical protein
MDAGHDTEKVDKFLADLPNMLEMVHPLVNSPLLHTKRAVILPDSVARLRILTHQNSPER